MRPSAWLHRYRWRIAIILGFPAVGIFLGFLAKVAIAYPELIVGLIAGLFAWGQWHISRQSLILNLFEKRLDVFKKVEAAIKRARTTTGTIHDWDASVAFERGRIRFLFGEDVASWLRSLHLVVADRLEALKRRQEGELSTEELQALDHLIKLGRERLGPARREWVDMCAPYLRMDQKLPRPPQEWPAAFAAWLKRKWNERTTGE